MRLVRQVRDLLREVGDILECDGQELVEASEERLCLFADRNIRAYGEIGGAAERE